MCVYLNRSSQKPKPEKRFPQRKKASGSSFFHFPPSSTDLCNSRGQYSSITIQSISLHTIFFFIFAYLKNKCHLKKGSW